MSGTQAIQPVSLGRDRAYVWQHPDGAATRAAISAHGCSRSALGETQAYRPDRIGPSLGFFCYHGQPTPDEGLAMYTMDRIPPVEIIPANMAPDYLLSKYTNTTDDATGWHRHNNAGESYRTVQGLVSWSVSSVNYADRAATSGAAGDLEGMANFIDKAWSVGDQRPDIITISGRALGTGVVRLSDLLVWLEEKGIHYQRLSCCFCRSPSPPLAAAADLLLRAQ